MNLAQLLLAGRYTELTSYFSNEYLYFFLPISIIGYCFMPQKAKKYYLLTASMVFYWLISGKLILFLLITVMTVHHFALWLDRIRAQKDAAVKECEREERKQLKKAFQKKSRAVLAFAAVVHIGALLMIKYSPFFTENINSLLKLFHSQTVLEIPKFIMPIGISFFTLQAVSYLVDVYRGVSRADDNIFRVALFMSFFPQIVEGPICRYEQTAPKLWNVKKIDYQNFSLGITRVLYGYMKKLVVADRLNPLIQEVFDNYNNYDGGMIALAAVFYTVQLYMDFSGTMDAVIGTAQVFGVELPENFRRPFFSKTISEFWQRWHITLGTWFKDYIFYPVTMSKPMKNLTSSARKKLGNHFGPLVAGSVALFCVWFSNGLWHGAAWSYIFFGMYHFVLILCGNIISPAVRAVNTRLHISPEKLPYRLMQILRSCVLVVIGELFFRANGLRAGLAMFKKLFTDMKITLLTPEVLKPLGIDLKDIAIVLVTVAIVFVISLLNEKGIPVGERINSLKLPARWAILFTLIMFIVIFGAYGPGYIPVDPIYAEF